jgi:hypothetical protein
MFHINNLNTMLNKKEISEYMSKNSKKGHKNSPRSHDFYVMIGKKGALKRWGKKLSTEQVVL